MNMLKNTKLFDLVFIFVLFIGLHLGLLNINASEWGDSYRILRASETVRDGFYPEDEKRPPLFSIFLALRPESIDPVLWSRFVMFGLSLIFFFMFYKFLSLFNLSDKAKKISLLLLTFNPVFLYWSIRIMADVPFALVVLFVFYYLIKFRQNPTILKSVGLGLLTGISPLLRFEGYLLVFSVLFGLMYVDRDFKCIKCLFYFRTHFRQLLKNIKFIFSYLLGSLIVLVPYWSWRNPITSSYLEEPGGRVYDFKMVLIYLISLLFSFGLVYAPYVAFKGRDHFRNFFYKNVGIYVFVLLELILILAWPAAVPRLFVSILFLLIPPLALSIEDLLGRKFKFNIMDSLLMTSGLLLYILVQFTLRLQFLVSVSDLLVCSIFFQVLIGLAYVSNKKRLLLASFIVGGVFWAISVIYAQKDILRVVKDANVYANKNLVGLVGYNDVSSVSNWYLNQDSTNPQLTGVYYNIDPKKNKTREEMLENGLDYLIVSNEHNKDLDFDVGKRDFLNVVQEFRYNIQGVEFWAKVIEIK